MAIERRDVVIGLGAWLALGGSAPAHAGPHPRSIYAAWDAEGRHHVGTLMLGGPQLAATASTEVPTRAHGLLAGTDGSVIAVARRPGDWLLRWYAHSGRVQWHWAPPGVAFNGHALLAGDRLLVTQTDLDSGAGQVSVLDAATLQPLGAWPTHGVDPHALLLHRGRLWVANGGIATQPETGRSKLDLDRMDSSLVALHPRDGRLLGQWRVDDHRLSLRHLAASSALLGAAMQAEHDDATKRAHAPLLAVCDGEVLRVIAPPPHSRTGGYAGDIAGTGTGFVLSATRADGVFEWSVQLGWTRTTQLLRPGALWGSSGTVLCAGNDEALQLGPGWTGPLALARGVQLDNHWVEVRPQAEHLHQVSVLDSAEGRSPPARE
jgi:hypothetical protein